MPAYLVIAPEALAHVKPYKIPLVHMAYAIDETGALARSELPAALRGGLMGLSDRGGVPKDSDSLLRAIAGECSARRFGGVFADFEAAAREKRAALLERLGAMLARGGRTLYVPQFCAVPSATVLIGTAVSGGTLRELLSSAVKRYGAARLALDCERLAMDFALPCRSGEGRAISQQELQALRQRCGASVFFSRELGAHYFSYLDHAQAHFVLCDDAETLRFKRALGRELGIGTSFYMYPEVKDILEPLFAP